MSRLIFEVVARNRELAHERAFKFINMTMGEERDDGFRHTLTGYKVHYHKVGKGITSVMLEHKCTIEMKLKPNKDEAAKDESFKAAIKMLKTKQHVQNVHLVADGSQCLIM